MALATARTRDMDRELEAALDAERKAQLQAEREAEMRHLAQLQERWPIGLGGLFICAHGGVGMESLGCCWGCFWLGSVVPTTGVSPSFEKNASRKFF